MDSLPPELISRVLDYIIPVGHSRRFPGIPLAPCATLDRRWQTIIESCTLSDIRINTPQRMEEFQRLVSVPRRTACVQGIEFVVELESYDEQARARFETDEERQRNNEIFTTTIGALFKILSSCTHDSIIEVDIKAMSPSDYLALKTWRERKQRRQAASSRVNGLTLNSPERPQSPSARMFLQSLVFQLKVLQKIG